MDDSQQVDTCTHESWSGVDQTPLDDPEKVWRCDGCDAVGTSETLSRA